ncbi:hypothetical protein DY000_02060086 [Brassica cretica]|uniref:Retrotransposon Copia-like N-terminal domain-containing protein n=1 Tax=Brassica cretica TaxID=69181 RepID=A0ABQ7AZW1_BRACR|nr:hypothetical protein DY000_02060086 [Brassica cretica]
MRRRKTTNVWELWDQPVRTRPYMAVPSVQDGIDQSSTKPHHQLPKLLKLSQLESKSKRHQPAREASHGWLTLLDGFELGIDSTCLPYPLITLNNPKSDMVSEPAGTSKGKEIDGREAGDGKSLVAYTGAPSYRGNNDQEYLRRSALDALIKIFKENGNTFGYSFGARAIENYKDLTRTDRMYESLIEMSQVIKNLSSYFETLKNRVEALKPSEEDQSSRLSCDKMENMKMKVAITFKGSNYLVWSRLVKTTIGSKGLWSHIATGEAPKLITEEEDQEGVSVDAVDKTSEGEVREVGDGKSLVAYTGGSSSNDYIRRSDMDTLIKMLKENDLIGLKVYSRV